MTPRMRQPWRGFTLIEMVAVLAIVALLAAAAMPLQEVAVRRVREQALREGLRTIRQALDAHRSAVESRRIAPGPDGSPWPAQLALLEQGIPVLGNDGRPAPTGERLYLLRRLPRDPFAEPALPAADTWGQRASDSPADAPAPGRDVFDVYTRAPGVALDGSRYAQW